MLFDWYSLWTLCVCMYMCLCLCVWLCVFECLPNSPRLNLPLCLRLMSFFIRETVQQSKNVARGCASLHLAFKYLFIYFFSISFFLLMLSYLYILTQSCRKVGARPCTNLTCICSNHIAAHILQLLWFKFRLNCMAQFHVNAVWSTLQFSNKHSKTEKKKYSTNFPWCSTHTHTLMSCVLICNTAPSCRHPIIPKFILQLDKHTAVSVLLSWLKV